MRITQLILPTLNANVSVTLFNGIPTEYCPDVTKATYIITRDGKSCLLEFRNGDIKLTPYQAITAGDRFSFINCYTK